MFHRAVTNWGSGEAPVDLARGRASPLYTVCAALILQRRGLFVGAGLFRFPPTISRPPTLATWPTRQGRKRIHNAGEIMREIAA